MAADYTGTADIAGGVPSFYNKKFLERFEAKLRMREFCQVTALPENNGTVAYWARMTTPSTMVSAARLQYSAGREPITPGNIVSTQISGTIEKYGWAIAIQDVTKLAAINSTVTEATDAMADQAGGIIDKRIIEEAYGSSSNAVPTGIGFSAIQYSTTGSAELTAVSAYYTTANATDHTMTTKTIRNAVKTMQGRNAPTFDDGFYALVCHSNTASVLQADTTWQAAYQYTDPENMRKGVVGTYGGAKIKIDNNIKSSANGSGGATVYFSLLLGKGGLGITELDGGVKYYTVADGASKYDPIDEFITIGWKALFVPVRLNLSGGLVLITCD
jgi:N4-gp56 family major capsid protein